MAALSTALLRFSILLFMFSFAALSKHIGETDKESLIDDIDDQQHFQQMTNEDDSMELALIDYLLAKHIAKRIHEQLDVSELMRKRSYWKQCAFNAVSCFGK